MNRRILLSLLLLVGLSGSLGSAWGQVRWRELPPEDRRQMRQQMREHWQQEREIRREEAVRRWQEVPPEERRRLREEIREQRAWQPAHDAHEGREPRGGRGWRRD